MGTLEKDEKGTAAAFVNILFGLVVTQAMIEIVDALRVGYVAEDVDAIHATRLGHLLLAMLVTSLSWIGYQQGTTRQFRIEYWNAALTTLVLDVGLVSSYYALIVLAEQPAGDHQPAIPADARPEAVLLAVVFLLYLAWDLTGLHLPGAGIGRWRLVVTAPAVVVVGLATVGVILVRPETPGGVIVADLVLATVAIAYRVAKQCVPES